MASLVHWNLCFLRLLVSEDKFILVFAYLYSKIEHSPAGQGRVPSVNIFLALFAKDLI